ncbi:hypothetical protein HYFRA_00005298 [Hymenoscyphus fraxineus]|uniref:Uncharacterized protein n=1 Tax=Hymenoscyphus fraxineus TaxID=746836 RepID=A0A9N9LAV0_9HELO|nr:hypothetical protein HYFRA_00005298 [Hymenoscyphus fraxineus]
MDENSRRRRQNESPYQGSDPRFNQNASTQGRPGGFAGASADRYRTSGGPLTTSPSAGRGSGAGASYSGYYNTEPQSSFGAALPASTMQYPSGYQDQRQQQQQQQQQGFTAYNADLNMYNVGQQTPQSAVFDSSQQFQARQAALPMGSLDVTTPYFAGEPTSAPGAPGLQHHASSGSSAVYQQHQQSPGDRAPMLQPGGYSTGMAMGMAQGAPDIIEDEFQAQGPGMEAAYTAYQTALKEIFQNIIHGRLATAGQSLLEVSEWLLGHVGDLGLTVDEVTLHSDRIRLWGEFNTAWLGIFMKQKDMLESGHRIQPPQNLMTTEFIQKMAKDLIRMCDAVEKHGLVDYQYGVGEEQIISILEECLDLQETMEGGASQGRAPP